MARTPARMIFFPGLARILAWLVSENPAWLESWLGSSPKIRLGSNPGLARLQKSGSARILAWLVSEKPFEPIHCYKVEAKPEAKPERTSRTQKK